jgi:hypothetical protein
LTSASGSVGYQHHINDAIARRRRTRLLTLQDMADGSDTTLTVEPAAPSGDLITDIKSFAAGHGGAKAVVEYVGRRGARIVLVGEDGTWADEFASGTDVARRACESAGIEVENEWERELIEQMRPSNDLWRSMGRRHLAR